MTDSNPSVKRVRLSELPSDHPFSHESRARRAKEDEDAARREYDRKRKLYLGNFSTELPCPCGSKVIDHASQYVYRPADPMQTMIGGRRRSWREIVNDFRVVHEYWCDTCGTVFKASVIEGVRGYIPRENRPEPTNKRKRKG